MALWKDNAKPSPSIFPENMQPQRLDAPPVAEPKPAADALAPAPAVKRVPAPTTAKSESLIAPDIAIEGKIEGTGHVRIAGRFKGDVDVRGDLTIEPGAKVNGSVRAEKVIIAGDLGGNIETASHVDLLQSGSLTGDLKAASLTVAAGSRMRGQVDFGWDEAEPASRRNGADYGKTS